jgi:hypothetical protein
MPELPKDKLMRQNSQGRIYDKKPLTFLDAQKDRDKKIWAAFLKNPELNNAELGERFGVVASTAREALKRMATWENLSTIKDNMIRHCVKMELIRRGYYKGDDETYKPF